MFLYYNKNNQVVMRSEGKNNCPQFREVELNLTAEELRKLESNEDIPHIINEKLEFKMSDRKKKALDLKSEIDNAKTITELKSILYKLF